MWLRKKCFLSRSEVIEHLVDLAVEEMLHRWGSCAPVRVEEAMVEHLLHRGSVFARGLQAPADQVLGVLDLKLQLLLVHLPVRRSQSKDSGQTMFRNAIPHAELSQVVFFCHIVADVREDVLAGAELEQEDAEGEDVKGRVRLGQDVLQLDLVWPPA